MNTLEQHIHLKNLSEVATMNALQDAGVVSDNCVYASDVAECDCTAAIAFLTFQGIKSLPVKPSAPAQSEMSLGDPLSRPLFDEHNSRR